MQIVFSQPQIERLFLAATARNEIGAAVYLREDTTSARFLIEEFELAEGSGRLSSTATEFTFAPEFLTRTTRIARQRGLSFGLLHSHPSGCFEFSTIDDAAEVLLRDFMVSRLQGRTVFSILLCDQTVRARVLATDHLVPVRSIGAQVRNYSDNYNLVDAFADDRFDRQIRAFGTEGQAILSKLRIAIVGLGGTGSVVAQQLSHLGIAKFTLIDPDTIETSNLNRVVGATPEDIGRPKVEVTAELIGRINPNSNTVRIPENAVSKLCANELRAVDCIFICTDSHVSRAFLSEFACQYVIPAFDVGVSIDADASRVTAITGRTQMLAPGLACLACAGVLDARAIREELMTPEQRAADPYFNSGGVRQPAVISINSTMVSLTVTMFLSAFLGVPGRARWQSYDGLSGTVRSIASRSDTDCLICGSSGVAALGTSRPLTFVGDLE